MSIKRILRTTMAVTRYVWDEIMRQGVDRTCSYKKHSLALRLKMPIHVLVFDSLIICMPSTEQVAVCKLLSDHFIPVNKGNGRSPNSPVNLHASPVFEKAIYTYRDVPLEVISSSFSRDSRCWI